MVQNSTHCKVSGNIKHDVDTALLEKDVPVPSDNMAKTSEHDNIDEGTDNSLGWDSWADDFISNATTKITTLMETVEGQLGIPDPALIAQNLNNLKIEEKEEESCIEAKSVDDQGDMQTDNTEVKGDPFKLFLNSLFSYAGEFGCIFI